MSSKKNTTSPVTKALWIVLPIVIIAAVVVAVFAGQSNSLTDQIAKLEADKQAISQDMDAAVRSAQEKSDTQLSNMNEQLEAADAKALDLEAQIQAANALAADAEARAKEAEAKAQEAEAKAQTAETRMQEAEAKAQSAEEKAQSAEAKAGSAEAQAVEAATAITNLTQERDQLKSEKDEITDGIKDVQNALNLLVGDDTALQLQEAQAALAAMSLERDELQNALIALTNERDDLVEELDRAANNAIVREIGVTVREADGSDSTHWDSISDMNLAELPAGDYTITVVVWNVLNQELAEYSFSYTAK